MGDFKDHFRKVLENYETKQRDLPRDYFNWGRDPRHIVDDTENMPASPRSKNGILRKYAKAALRRISPKYLALFEFDRRFANFEETYRLMSNASSKELFVELILMKLIGERKARLSTFDNTFVESYELASKEILESDDTLQVYRWVLRKVAMDDPSVTIYTTPVYLNQHYLKRLYSYRKNDAEVIVEKGDIIIDAGVGWGDTTVYLAAMANQDDGESQYFAFDILKEGMTALGEQMKANPKVKNITPVLKALSDRDDEFVHISAPSPGARIVEEETERVVKSISIDTFMEEQRLNKIDFIKMDIEGAEVPALKGAVNAIRQHKPKLAISVYHKWDDLLIIPRLIHSIRSDYEFYLDCTTGFGGEIVLYCR